MAIVLDGSNGITTNSGTVISASTIGVGGTTPSTSGAGITFPATQSASTDANTLDDYEEGTYTVTLTPNAGTFTMDTNRQTFQYVKVGRMVTIQGYTRPSSVSGASGKVAINLPFTSSAGTQFSGQCVSVVIPENLTSGNSNGFAVTIDSNSATAYIQYTAGGGSAANWLAVAEKFQANTNITVSITYQTAS